MSALTTRVFANNLELIATGVAPGDTSVGNILDGAGIAALLAILVPGQTILGTFDDGVKAPEIVSVSTPNNVALNMVRAQEGTVDDTWASGVLMSFRLTAGTLDTIVAILDALEAKDATDITQADIDVSVVAMINSIATVNDDVLVVDDEVVYI